MAAVEQQNREETVAAPAQSRGQLATIAPPRLPYHPAMQERFGIDSAAWRALVEAVFPAARSVEGVLLALSYCRARKLDPFKRPVHVVPIWDSNRRAYVESVWPGIGELRTTAFRTGNYAGSDAAAFGPDVTATFKGRVKDGSGWKDAEATVTYPEWCQFTVYRLIADQRVAMPGPRVYWRETYARMGKAELPNEMWQRRPRGQLEKCAEAAALRRAFPEEIGNEITAEEAAGQDMGALTGTTIEHEAPTPPRPERPKARQQQAEIPERSAEHVDEDGVVTEAEEPGTETSAGDLDDWKHFVAGWLSTLDDCTQLDGKGGLLELKADWDEYVAKPPGEPVPEAVRRQMSAAFIEAQQRIEKPGKGKR